MPTSPYGRMSTKLCRRYSICRDTPTNTGSDILIAISLTRCPAVTISTLRDSNTREIKIISGEPPGDVTSRQVTQSQPVKIQAISAAIRGASPSGHRPGDKSQCYRNASVHYSTPPQIWVNPPIFSYIDTLPISNREILGSMNQLAPAEFLQQT